MLTDSDTLADEMQRLREATQHVIETSRADREFTDRLLTELQRSTGAGQRN